MRALEKLVGIHSQRDKLVITSLTNGIPVAGYIRNSKGNMARQRGLVYPYHLKKDLAGFENLPGLSF